MLDLDDARRSIDDELASRGLVLRRPTLDDIPALSELQRAAFPELQPEQLTSDLTFYRLIEFGQTMVLSDASGEILGNHFIFQLNDAEKVAVSCGLAIHSRLKGLGVGGMIFRHSVIRLIAAGAQVMRGTISPTNFPSLATFLNKAGGLCDRFVAGMGVSRICRLCYYYELDTRSLSRPAIDLEKLPELIHRRVAGVDYQLVAPDDVDGLEAMYRSSEMRVAAVVPPGFLSSETMLLALPIQSLEAVRAELGRDDAG